MDNKAIEKAVVEQTERSLNRGLEQSEIDEILQWHRGTSLRELVNLPGWAILEDLTEDIIEDARSDYNKTIDQDPSKFKADDLKEKQAVAFGVKRGLTVFIQAVKNAVEFSQTPPDIVKSAARKLRSMPENSVSV